MLPYLQFLGQKIPLYGLMAVIGILASFLYIALTNHRKNAGLIPPADVLHIVLLAGVGAVVGAKTLSILTQIPIVIQNWGHVRQNPHLLLGVFTQGLVFYGGLLGGLLAVGWYCKKYSISLEVVLSLCTPAIPLFHAFGRIGCFFAGCCWGIPASFGIAFTHSPVAPNGTPLLPIQLIEAAANLILFLLFAVLSRRPVAKKRLFPMYLSCYGVLRFTLEFFRGDTARGVYWLSLSQWISLFIIGSAVLLMFHQSRQQNR